MDEQYDYGKFYAVNANTAQAIHRQLEAANVRCALSHKPATLTKPETYEIRTSVGGQLVDRLRPGQVIEFVKGGYVVHPAGYVPPFDKKLEKTS